MNIPKTDAGKFAVQLISVLRDRSCDHVIMGIMRGRHDLISPLELEILMDLVDSRLSDNTDIFPKYHRDNLGYLTS